MNLDPVIMIKDIESILTAVKAIVPASLIGHTSIGTKLIEIESALNALVTIVHGLQTLAPANSTAPSDQKIAPS